MGIFDIFGKKKQLMELQKLLIPDSTNTNILPERELLRLANQTINNNMRIIAESEKIIKKTKDVDTFNSRMKLIDDCVLRTKAILPYIKTDVSQSQLMETYTQEKISLEWDFKAKMRQEIQKYSLPYYETIEKIEAAWSVLNTFKSYDGENAKSLEKMCKQSIKLFQKYIDKVRELNLEYETPKHVPAFVRLAMLYEKQENYQKAIDICVQAIQLGAYEDKSNGKMYGRLARMIKKSGIDVSPDIIKLSELQ